jgi:hypothetical protein
VRQEIAGRTSLKGEPPRRIASRHFRVATHLSYYQATQQAIFSSSLFIRFFRSQKMFWKKANFSEN